MTDRWIELDGAMGEGGGQVLRTALSLSMLTGSAVKIQNIRTNRSNPGLSHQHLTALQAAREISGAEVQGEEIGSRAVAFNPGVIQPGSYHFQIPTAGSTSLVLQTVYLPLTLAASSSVVEVVGGTHVPWSPCFHYLDWVWMPSLRQLGYETELTLVRCGYYPQGGGSILAEIQPGAVKNPLQCLDRGRLLQIRGLSAVTNLPEDIARRQRHRLVHRLGSEFPLNDLRVSSLPGTGKGTFLVVLLEYEQARACFFSLGERGKRAEKVADEVADSVIAHHHAQGCLDAYLGDQLLLPLCLSNQSTEASLSRITPHLLTNAAVIRQFLPVDIVIEGEPDQPGLLRIDPRDF